MNTYRIVALRDYNDWHMEIREAKVVDGIVVLYQNEKAIVEGESKQELLEKVQKMEEALLHPIIYLETE